MPRKHPETEELEELEEQMEEEKNAILEASRKAILAYVGAVGMAQDEAMNLFNRCVKRGEVAEKDAGKMLKSINSRSKRASRRFDRQVERLLNTVSIPSTRDVHLLNAQMATINEKLDKLTVDSEGRSSKRDVSNLATKVAELKAETEDNASKRDVSRLATKVAELRAETEDNASKRDVSRLAAKVNELKEEIPQRKK